ncbi:MAG: MerR family transcriptional regulator, partial [Actinomycetota bacterium]|nr:MerR family transcriptional regulator [Actinomycetota bacterium]
MDLSIQEVSKITGVTSRTLRHYDAVGLLAPSRTGVNGYRFYDDDALVRLQRVLLLRELGLGLDEIAAVLDRETDEVVALRAHLDWIAAERERLERQHAAVSRTVRSLEGGGEIVAKDMFDGFDHTQYKDEVIERWGGDTYEQSSSWWTSLTDDEKRDRQGQAAELAAAWSAGAASGLDPASDEAQALAQRHVDWLSAIPGTPGHGSGKVDTGYLLGLADMYVADPRFAENYGGETGATWVREVIREWVAR